MKIMEERIKNASYKTTDILRSLQAMRKDFRMIENNVSKMNEKLKVEKTHLNIVVEKMATVKTEQDYVIAIQEDIEIVRSAETVSL